MRLRPHCLFHVACRVMALSRLLKTHRSVVVSIAVYILDKLPIGNEAIDKNDSYFGKSVGFDEHFLKQVFLSWPS